MKGPPDHNVSKFRVSVSAPGGPIGMAPRRPFPRGYVVRMMSLPFAGTVDHSIFAFDKSTNPQVARSNLIWNNRIIGVDELVRSGLDHHRCTGDAVVLLYASDPCDVVQRAWIFSGVSCGEVQYVRMAIAIKILREQRSWSCSSGGIFGISRTSDSLAK